MTNTCSVWTEDGLVLVSSRYCCAELRYRSPELRERLEALVLATFQSYLVACNYSLLDSPVMSWRKEETEFDGKPWTHWIYEIRGAAVPDESLV